jgi:hypothetical protein
MSNLCDVVTKITGCGIPEGAPIDKIVKASYYRVSVSLNEAVTNEKLSIAGEFLTVGKINGYASCEIRFNHPNATLVNLREVREMKGHFDDIYFTTDGYGYECVLYVATSPNATIRTGEPIRYDGSALSGSVNSKNYIRRFHEEEYIMNDFWIRNTHAANTVEIGVLHPDYITEVATFRNYSWRIAAGDVFRIGKINLRTFGYVSTVDDQHVNLKYLGSIHE